MNWEGTISLLVASIEVLLIFNLLVFVDKNKINILIIFLVFLLAAYQFTEFLICNQELKTPFYSYIALVIITFVPTVNFFLINRITNYHKKKTFKFLEIFFSLVAVFFIVFYGLNYHLFEVKKCTVFYATYNYPIGFLYGVYYYLPILISLLMILNVRKNSAEQFLKSKLRILLIGYFFIITPPLIGFFLRAFGLEEVSISMESILCKFAFFYALTISFYSIYNSKFKDERDYFKYLSGYK